MADGNTKHILEIETNRMDNDLENNDNLIEVAKDANDNHSGRLVVYSSDSSDNDDDADRATPERPREPSPTYLGTPASPSPSPTQRRRNEQGEAVLSTFSSRGILYLLGESLRRESSIRQSALQ